MYVITADASNIKRWKHSVLKIHNSCDAETSDYYRFSDNYNYAPAYTEKTNGYI